MAFRVFFTICLLVQVASLFNYAVAQYTTSIATLNLPAGAHNAFGTGYSFQVLGTARDGKHTTFAFQKVFAQPTTTGAPSGATATATQRATRTQPPGTMIIGPTEVIVHAEHVEHGKFSESCTWPEDSPQPVATCIVGRPGKPAVTGVIPVKSVEVKISPHSGAVPRNSDRWTWMGMLVLTSLIALNV